MDLEFAKMQGAGNDFVVVESAGLDLHWNKIALAMCDRHYGVGADGLLLLTPSETADFGMRIWNADGSEARMCGNGIRCLVKHFVESNGFHEAKTAFSVETPVGLRRTWVERTGPRVTRVKVDMGVPGFLDVGHIRSLKKDIEPDNMTPCDGDVFDELDITLVSMGNHHAVYFTEIPLPDFPLAEVAASLACHEDFPVDVNFEVARVIASDHIEARVWEHGVGETLACGSGACAIAATARLSELAGGHVEVSLPGGTLDVEWDGVSELFLIGPAEMVFQGTWSVVENEGVSHLLDRSTKNEVLA